MGIGIGTPGLINTNEGVVVNAVNLDWKNLSLAHPLQEKYHLPVLVFNDSQAAAMGEYTYGRDHSSDDNLIVINARNGIGAGIIINRQLFQGDGGGAGEIGHVVVVHEGGQQCRCGNRGCLETVASSQALIKRMQTLVSQANSIEPIIPVEEITLNTIEKALMNGNPLARQVVLESGQYMGMASLQPGGHTQYPKYCAPGRYDPLRSALVGSSSTNNFQGNSLQAGAGYEGRDRQLGGNSIILGSSAMLASNYSLLFRNHTLTGSGNIQNYS